MTWKGVPATKKLGRDPEVQINFQCVLTALEKRQQRPHLELRGGLGTRLASHSIHSAEKNVECSTNPVFFSILQNPKSDLPTLNKSRQKKF